MDSDPAEPASDPGADQLLDLAHLRDLLKLLTEFDVAEFRAGDLALSFQGTQSEHVPAAGRTEVQVIEDEDRSTSSRQVEGFGIWGHKSLWEGQNGRRLQFDGSLK